MCPSRHLLSQRKREREREREKEREREREREREVIASLLAVFAAFYSPMATMPST